MNPPTTVSANRRRTMIMGGMLVASVFVGGVATAMVLQAIGDRREPSESTDGVVSEQTPTAARSTVASGNDQGVVRGPVVYYYILGEDPYDRERAFEALPFEVDHGPIRETLRLALLELLRGPTEEQVDRGFGSAFTSETEGFLNGITLRRGRLTINFRDYSRLLPNASTSNGSGIMLTQIYGTAFQFPAVREVSLQFDGSCQSFWSWLGAGCEVRQRGSWGA